MDNVKQKMQELMNPIEMSITTNDRNELLMIACGMLQIVKNILTHQLGKEGMMELINGSLRRDNGNTTLH